MNQIKIRKEVKYMNHNYSAAIELAELVRANVSGPVKAELIRKAQERLVNRLRESGALSAEEADELLV